jgi:hypothetical protein
MQATKLSALMEPEGSLLRPQKPVTGPQYQPHAVRSHTRLHKKPIQQTNKLVATVRGRTIQTEVSVSFCG